MLLKQRSQQIWNWEGFCTQTGSEHCSLDSSDLQTKLMKHSGSSQAALPQDFTSLYTPIYHYQEGKAAACKPHDMATLNLQPLVPWAEGS